MEATVKQPSGRDLLSPEAQFAFRSGSNIATVLLVCVAAVALGFGLLMLAPATMGVGVICAGCCFAVLARIAQAGYQHKQVIAMLERDRP